MRCASVLLAVAATSSLCAQASDAVVTEAVALAWSEPEVANALASDDVERVAWGGFAVAERRLAALAPNVLTALRRQPPVVERPRDHAERLQARRLSGLHAALLDALVRSDVAVPGEEVIA